MKWEVRTHGSTHRPYIVYIHYNKRVSCMPCTIEAFYHLNWSIYHSIHFSIVSASFFSTSLDDGIFLAEFDHTLADPKNIRPKKLLLCMFAITLSMCVHAGIKMTTKSAILPL